MKPKLILISVIIAAILIISTLLLQAPRNFVEISQEKITIETARTESEIARGLMYREELCADCGMLFIFEKEGPQSFWMKNTLIPLDMIFISKDLTIVDIIPAEPCTEDPCQFYFPKQKALYVLETNNGRFNPEIIGEKIKLSI